MTETKNNQLTDILNQLSPNQIRFIVARLDCESDAEAARHIGLEPNTVCKWTERNLIRQALSLVALDAINGVRSIIERNGAKAAMVKAKGLESDDESIRQKASTEIINWVIGDPKKQIDVTSGGEALTINIIRASETKQE